MDIIVDVDGTVADIRHRLPVPRLPNGRHDWEAFHSGCIRDAPNVVVCEAVRHLRLSHAIIICTGRPNRWRTVTEEFIGRNIGTTTSLMMRADSDHRPDVELKREMLRNMRAAGYDPVLAFEDRDDVVAMWREEGLVCAQVAKGAY